MGRGKSKPFYPLAEVRSLIEECRVDISSRVRAQAKGELECDEGGILEAILALGPADWDKSMPVEYDPGCVADVYKPVLAGGGDRAYIKFYIDQDNRLRVLSFKLK